MGRGLVCVMAATVVSRSTAKSTQPGGNRFFTVPDPTEAYHCFFQIIVAAVSRGGCTKYRIICYLQGRLPSQAWSRHVLRY
ncbi:hypothetical protein B0I72DRAFT_134237 [Yarrowia lipolytica]|uniref:Uncharacterized protein n=1 Tax=Yarrowia lipolytica TaxID=4952 RepID=A0A371C895_YARLL|nr:hypothetical protein BKA91DRAFT_132199 [Yarrowia lipolytica]KAE8174676.1 hypothetical protein BKA90DRAFT_133799 [Yarrowia lipolytica]RDW26524.1 hypothetical protein B0I71DRAFT_130677 [Yarrowia lipolytica]RDW34761.1 hypothetical protein B0I72DRAFT_134237 [Yarrowia lipolytica]RDW37315.1 hypothetical protein B0I73DRAFT_135695 [Yarrowia lipolytica]